ncbi:MAG TPA: ArdC-like ssDNA-binding domain-containing protein [Phycisphaerae bacterium]|nr:ArdC-like ssDNA-binding domain-containing protein [Phycisphaerae bacterium]HRY66364.1 ArdC-like ssDNA-binding domain-containing protein [Phycisphaerae bacterium]HSA25930.1 ArdC-like ssDNA-binding domain-containing protein [Phycisphaerae bacterium]
MNSTQAAELTRSIQTKLEQLAKAVDEQRASKEFKELLDFQARFHRYSWGNCLLIAISRPDATRVAGFAQWKKMGRTVKPGEKAIRILAPCPVRRENEKTGEEEERVFFKTACVFDISQTSGKDLPCFEVPEVLGHADDLLHKLEAVAARRGIQVAYRQLGDGHYGNSQGGRIEIALGHDTAQQAKTLAHELAHERIHRSADGQVDPHTTREMRESEAEAVAYLVCRHFELDVELRASRYIALWDGDAKILGASLSRISAAARELIEDAAKETPNSVASVSTPGSAAAA